MGLKAKEFGIEVKDNIININFGDKKRGKKIKKCLYNSLACWDKIIKIVV